VYKKMSQTQLHIFTLNQRIFSLTEDITMCSWLY